MKIGILTYVHAYNYGAELQCFALQRKLRNLGYDVEVIDQYRPDDPEYKKRKSDNRFAPLYSYNSKKDFRFKIHTMISRFVYKSLYYFNKDKFTERKRKFKGFHDTNTRLSPKKYYNYWDLYENDMPYTHIIVGSDQVWNYATNISTEPYFLTFAKDGLKKISYAASIGHKSIPTEVATLYRKWLADFSAISLREIDGVDIIKSITDRKDIKHVLDPVFLLTKQEWGAYFNKYNDDNEEYILLYLLSKSAVCINLAYEVASKTGWKIKLITTEAVPLTKYNGIEMFCGDSPERFVSLFLNASFIITNSFHGTAFSVNFQKPFVVVSRHDKRVNSRFESLLKLLQIKDRLVYEGEDIQIDSLLQLSYDRITPKLEEERNKSLTFIEQSLT